MKDPDSVQGECSFYVFLHGGMHDPLAEKSLATDKGDGITGDEIVACLER